MAIKPMRLLLQANGLLDAGWGGLLYGWGGLLYYAWVIPGAVCTVIFAMAYVRFLMHLPPKTRWLFTMAGADRKSTRLNSSHSQISYAVFCLKKKNALVAQHARAVDVDDGAQEVLQAGSVKVMHVNTDLTLYVVIAAIAVRMLAVLSSILAIVMYGVDVVLLEEVGIDVQVGIEVEIAQAEVLIQGHFAEMHGTDGRAQIHVLEPVDEPLLLFFFNKVPPPQIHLFPQPHLPPS